MKKLNRLFLFLLLNSGLYAMEDLYSFMGVQTSVSGFDSTIVPSIGIKYGVQSADVRSAIEYNYGRNANHNYQTLMLKVDTGIFPNLFSNKSIRPYIGGSLGLMQVPERLTRDRGSLYGINTGISYILNEDMDLDLGYRFLKTSSINEIDYINDLMFSIHYFY